MTSLSVRSVTFLSVTYRGLPHKLHYDNNFQVIGKSKLYPLSLLAPARAYTWFRVGQAGLFILNRIGDY